MGEQIDVQPPAEISQATGSRRMKTENIIRIVPTVIGTAVAAFAISVVVAGHWWVTPPPPPPPPPPSVNVAAVSTQVVGLLRDQWNTTEGLKDYGVTFDDDLVLINTGLNKYEGLATAHTRKGTQKFLSVLVTADPTGAMFYQPEPGSAANLIDAASKEQ